MQMETDKRVALGAWAFQTLEEVLKAIGEVVHKMAEGLKKCPFKNDPEKKRTCIMAKCPAIQGLGEGFEELLEKVQPITLEAAQKMLEFYAVRDNPLSN